MPTSVVVPNFDGERLLPACLVALAAQTRAPAEVIVVDDGSRDGSLALLATRFPWVRVVALPENRGFAAAVNAGIAAATAPCIALLNNDASADPGWLAALEAAADARPDVDVFASRMVTVEHPARIDSFGLALTHGFGQVSPDEGERDGPAFAGERPVFGACGGAALYRRRCFERIGRFDESLRILWEDVDVALRARLAGLATLGVGAARVVHLGSATIGRSSARGAFHSCRNRLHVLAKSVPAGLLLREGVAIAWVTLKLVLLHARRGQGLPALRGTLVGLGRAVPALFRRRPRSAPGAAEMLAADLAAGSAERRRQRARRGERVPHGQNGPAGRP